MITDNYLTSAIETMAEVKKELEAEISRLKQHDVETANLENILRLLKKIDSFLVRIQEAFN